MANKHKPPSPNHEFVTWLYNGLLLRDKNNPITANSICSAINQKHNLPAHKAITPEDVREVVNHLRREKMLPVMACGKGYYTARSVHEVEAQIKQMRQRMESMLAAIDGLTAYTQNPNLLTQLRNNNG